MELTKRQKELKKLEDKLCVLAKEAGRLGLDQAPIVSAADSVAREGKYRQRIYCHNTEGWITDGSRRVIAWGAGQPKPTYAELEAELESLKQGTGAGAQNNG